MKTQLCQCLTELERIGRSRMASAKIGNSNAKKEETTLSMIDKVDLDEVSEVEEVVPHNTRK